MAFFAVTFVRDSATGQILFDSNGYPLVGVNNRSQFANLGGILVFTSAAQAVNWPTSAFGLGPGSVWNNGLTVAIVPGGVPALYPMAVYLNYITPPALLALGGSNLPITQPAAGSGQLWNNGYLVCVA